MNFKGFYVIVDRRGIYVLEWKVDGEGEGVNASYCLLINLHQGFSKTPSSKIGINGVPFSI